MCLSHDHPSLFAALLFVGASAVTSKQWPSLPPSLPPSTSQVTLQPSFLLSCRGTSHSFVLPQSTIIPFALLNSFLPVTANSILMRCSFCASLLVPPVRVP